MAFFLCSGNSLGGVYGETDAYERRRRARSNDFLDRIDVSVVSNTTRSAQVKRKSTPKMSRVEHGLYLGSLEAATDVILLESNAISHIVTVDSVPLPRKITSMMPRIAMLHLQVRLLFKVDGMEKRHKSFFDTEKALLFTSSLSSECVAPEGHKSQFSLLSFHQPSTEGLKALL